MSLRELERVDPEKAADGIQFKKPTENCITVTRAILSFSATRQQQFENSQRMSSFFSPTNLSVDKKRPPMVAIPRKKRKRCFVDDRTSFGDVVYLLLLAMSQVAELREDTLSYL